MIPRPGPHGGDGPAVARALGIPVDQVVDLSLSLNPFAPDVRGIAARHLDALRHYPDARAATTALAGSLGGDVVDVLLTNGGSEAIALVAATVGGTVAREPEFSLHPRGGRGPVWQSNPHNPSGELAREEARADVWDEAFFPLATGAWTRGDAAHGAVVVGSLTKVFACPGLRLGYVLADGAAERFAPRQPEWSVNGVALAVLPELLAQADLDGWSKAVAARRTELVALLATNGLEAASTDAPWVLVNAPGLRDRLAAHGVVVRDCASFGMPGWMRIAVPDDRGLSRLQEVLPCTTR